MNVLLIPIVGILGSAISNITAYFLLAAIAAFWARKSVNYTMNYKYLAKVIMATLIMSVFFYFWKMDGIIGLILASIIGIIIFIAGLLILKAFSEQDKKFIKRTLAGTFFVKE
jgi:O-antigen/teichoic acid export membrane protein